MSCATAGSCMKASTREWIVRAEEDFAVVLTLARPRKKPLWAPLCFHAQQCAEKYLKARLQEAGLAFPRTHSLPGLLQLVLPVQPLWSALSPASRTNLSRAINRMPLVKAWASRNGATP